MKRQLVALVALMIGVLTISAAQIPAPPPPSATAAATVAARAFLGLLTAEQRPVAAMAYTDSKKTTWHNGPPSLVPRPGLNLGDMTPAQRAAATTLMRAILSDYGYDKVNRIMQADAYFGTNMGATFATGPDAYSVAVYGTPSDSVPWMAQINGHHLGLNVTVVGAENLLSPTLIGAYPATFTENGRTIGVLDDETGRAFALMNALSATQQSKATLPSVVMDLVLGPGQDDKQIEPEGLKGSDMTPQQRDLLLDLTAAWVNVLPRSAATRKMAEIRSHLSDTYFAWSGEIRVGGRAYFRVQGPTVFIEYAPQVNVGGPGAAQGLVRERDPNHIHTIFRDFSNDYGRKYGR